MGGNGEKKTSAGPENPFGHFNPKFYFWPKNARAGPTEKFWVEMTKTIFSAGPIFCSAFPIKYKG